MDRSLLDAGMCPYEWLAQDAVMRLAERDLINGPDVPNNDFRVAHNAYTAAAREIGYYDDEGDMYFDAWEFAENVARYGAEYYR